MQSIELKDFQVDIVNKLLDVTLNGDKQQILLQSPTGSGKTIILLSFIEEYYKELSNSVFIWLTPGTGDLEEQSMNKMRKVLPGYSCKNLRDVLTSGFDFGDTCFINWETITKKGNNALKETEKKNLFERITQGHNKGCKYIVLVDEEDKNNTFKAKAIIDFINPEYIIRASATTRVNPEAEFIKINDIDVINAGLITKSLYINEGVPSNVILSNEHECLLDLAINKRNEISEEYKKLNIQINPLVIIQMPNDSEELIKQIEEILESRNISYKNGSLAIWLSERKTNIDNISLNEAIPSFLIMKEAISTGWDCPRAKILVKLRTNMTEDFEIQTIGRIRRMPQAHHYDNVILDNCYLYTFDEEYEETIKQELGKNASDSKIVFLKDKFKNFSLKSQTFDKDIDDYDERQTFRILKEFYVKKYNLTNDKEKNKLILETNNYIFTGTIQSDIVQDRVVSIDDENIGEDANRIRVQSIVNVKKNSYEMRLAINNISSKIGIRSDRTRLMLERLFYKGRVFSNKFLSLSINDFYSFVINNENQLKIDFEEATKQRINQGKLKLEYIKEFDWKMISKDYVKYNKSSKDKTIFSKETYEDYPSSVKGSKSERMFEFYCENSDNVKWFHKNGESSSDYFSIVYINAVQKYKHFYPDFIVCDKNDNIWIIETKGGENTDGESKNIDQDVENKFEALKNYANKYNINWAFVRDYDQNEHLYFSNSEYNEEMENDNWILIDELFK